MLPFAFHLDTATLYAIAGALGLLVLDWVLGVLVALRTHTFAWNLLPRQLETLIAANLAGLGFAGLLQALTSGGLSTAIVAFVVAAAATSSTRSLIDITQKLVALGANVTAPPSPALGAVKPVATPRA